MRELSDPRIHDLHVAAGRRSIAPGEHISTVEGGVSQGGDEQRAFSGSLQPDRRDEGMCGCRKRHRRPPTQPVIAGGWCRSKWALGSLMERSGRSEGGGGPIAGEVCGAAGLGRGSAMATIVGACPVQNRPEVGAADGAGRGANENAARPREPRGGKDGLSGRSPGDQQPAAKMAR